MGHGVENIKQQTEFMGADSICFKCILIGTILKKADRGGWEGNDWIVDGKAGQTYNNTKTYTVSWKDSAQIHETYLSRGKTEAVKYYH